MLNRPAQPPHPCNANSKRLQRYSNATSKRKSTMHNNSSFTDEQDERPAAIEDNGRDQPGEELGLPPETRLPAGVSSTPSPRRPPGRKQFTLIAVVVSLLLAASALLLPILLAQPGQLATTSHPVTAAGLAGHASHSQGLGAAHLHLSHPYQFAGNVQPLPGDRADGKRGANHPLARPCHLALYWEYSRYSDAGRREPLQPALTPAPSAGERSHT